MKRPLLLIPFLLLFAQSALGQITGRVIDINGGAIPGVQVRVLTPDSIPVSATLSASDGAFSLIVSCDSFPEILIEASHPGFTTDVVPVANTAPQLSVGNLVLQDRQLPELVVMAERGRLFETVDGQTYLPSLEDIRHSNNGYTMLRNLQIPRLNVDVVSKSVTLLGGIKGNVELYINEREASKQDVVSLLPDEILRVEFVDKPQIRFGSDAEAAVNFVTKRSLSGYSLGIDLTNAVTTGKGNNFLSGRYNNQASEWSLRYSNDYGVMKDRLIDQTDTYHFDTDPLTITRKGILTPLSYRQHDLSLVYDYLNPFTKLNLRIELGGSFYDSPERGHRQRVSEAERSDWSDYYAYTDPTEKNHIPYLDFYLSKPLSEKNTLMAQLVATYIDTSYGYHFTTYTDSAFSSPIDSYGYVTDGKRLSLIGEAKDLHRFSDALRLTSGLRLQHGRLENRYTTMGTDVKTDNRLSDSQVYLYANLVAQLSPKLIALVGLGAEYLGYAQDKAVVDYLNIRPTVQLTYTLPHGWKANYYATIYTAYPSLSQLSDVRQEVNRYEVKQGNPNLKPFRQYSQNLSLSFTAPRFYITDQFMASIYDTERPAAEPEVIRLEDLETDAYRLSFLIDVERAHLEKEKKVSLRAGELVGKLYDALLKEYRNPDDPETLRHLNILAVRIVFCLYAEDAGLFGKRDSFLSYLSACRGPAFRDALIRLFNVFDTPQEQRDPYLSDTLLAFPYVNGGLFSMRDTEVPRIPDEVQTLILDEMSQGFNWSMISPTIFGGLFESTLNPDTRREGGMHYTSVENIHRVIDPLFMDDLKAELETILEIKQERTRQVRLRNFQEKIASLTFLDPAAGSGNFLTETYLSLRRLENKVIAALSKGAGRLLGTEILNPIHVSIDHFYGIEINDFAVAVARTALWIAEAQMLEETRVLGNFDGLTLFPLTTRAHIVEANALRTDWTELIAPDRLDYIIGNPPLCRRDDDVNRAKERIEVFVP